MFLQPDLSHAVLAARLGRRVLYAVVLHPGWWAFVCWLLWHFLTSTAVLTAASAIDVAGAQTAQVPLVQYTDATYQVDGTQLTRHHTVPAAPAPATGPEAPPHVARVSYVTATFIAGTRLAGTTFTFVALVLGLASFLTTPTHVLGSDRRLHPVGRGLGRPTLAGRAARRGAYARIKAGHAGIVADWRASKRDAAAVEKRLARVGRWRLTRWGRQWAREDAAGAERTGPGRIDRWLIRRNEPPKTTVGRKLAERRAERKANRRGGPGEYESDGLPPPPPPAPEMPERPHVDPADGPPLSPRQQDEHAERLATNAETDRDEVGTEAALAGQEAT